MQHESPEWMPASSMCSIRPPITQRRAVGHGVDVHLDRVLEELVDEDRLAGRDLGRQRRERGASTRRRRRSPSRGRRARAKAARAPGSRSSGRWRRPDRRWWPCRWRAGGGSSFSRSPLNRPRSPAMSMSSGLVPMIGTFADSSALREVERRLAAELDDHALGLEPLAQVEHVLGGQRLEEQHVGGVVVGRHRLRVAVDHHRLVARVAQGVRRLDAAVVELDALADAVGPAAQDHDPRLLRGAQLVLFLVGRVVVRRRRLELGRARVDALVDRLDAAAQAVGPHLLLGQGPDDARAGGRRTRGASRRAARRRAPTRASSGPAAAPRRRRAPASRSRNHGSMFVRPWMTSTLHPRFIATCTQEHALGARDHEASFAGPRRRSTRRPPILRVEPEAEPPGLEAAQRLLERLLEGAPDRHPLADGLHLRRQHRARLGELLEVEARHLRHDVVDRRLEARPSSGA